MEKKPDFKTMSTKTKLEYVWDYYKWHIIGTIAVAAFVISMVYHYVSYREPLLNVIMINCSDSYQADSHGFYEFQEAYGYEPDEYPVSVASFFLAEDDAAASYTDYQALTTLIAAGGEDLFFGTGTTYLSYCEQGAMIDLSTILSPELLAEYEDCLIYSTADGETAPYPCAIELTDNEWLRKNNYYDTCYFGIFYNNQNLNACREFAEFLLTYE